MKKLLIIVLFITGMFGIANATRYDEEYAGTQTVLLNETYNFGFDFWYHNSNPVVTDSDLLLILDVNDADLFLWKSIELFIDFSAPNNTTADIILTMWDLGGDIIPVEFVSEIVNFDGVFKYSYMFTEGQLDDFASLGWGNITISNSRNNNPFTITKVGMEVTPVPEPSTILLISCGLCCLASFKFI